MARLRAWLDSLDPRRDELAESYRRQRTRQELFYLIEGRGEPLLVIVSESDDLQRGAEEFLRSGFALDAEFKQLIQQVGEPAAGIELVYDSRDFVPVDAAARPDDGDRAGEARDDARRASPDRRGRPP